MSRQRFPIGTQYISAGKHPLLCTVEDFITCTNLAGEIVKVYYICSHEFCGQTVTEHGICETTIAKGIFRLNEANSKAGA